MKIPILMYHEVYQSAEYERLRSLTNPAYNIAVGAFRRQVGWLSENNIRAVTIDELFSVAQDEKKRAICLTFDDGWEGNFLNAFPVLQKYDLKGTFFIATSLIGSELYMTWDHLKEMKAFGMSIQSHGVSHRPLGAMTEKEIRQELSESREVIQDRLGTKVEHLSLPHGSKNDKVWPIAEEVGYISICTSDVGYYQSIGSSSPWVKRISVGDDVPERRFYRLAHAQERAIWGMKVGKAAKDVLKRTIGIEAYRRLYLRFYNIRGSRAV